LRADRQPEFTQIDMELSFVSQDDVIDLNERLMKTLFKEILGVDIPTPFPRMPYSEAMRRFGSDKPDVRFGMELVDISGLAAGSEFGVFNSALASGGSVRGINAKKCGSLPRKQIDALVEFAKGYGAKGLAWITVAEDGSVKTSLSKFFSVEQLDAMVKAFDGSAGDLILICADKDSVVFDTLGALRLEMAGRLGILRNDDYKFLWVTEFPLLEWSEDDGRFFAKHHPFTAPMDEDLELLESDPGAVRAKAYDMVLNGVELGGGSLRIFQRDIQERMFRALGFTPEEAQKGFGFLLEAFKYGAPPHGGLAFGFDRIMMLMTGSESIRDVIAFPKVKDASCPMTDAPNTVSAAQLKELGLSISSQV
jgi:aspartyl-tRNA synthetase